MTKHAHKINLAIHYLILHLSFSIHVGNSHRLSALPDAFAIAISFITYYPVRNEQSTAWNTSSASVSTLRDASPVRDTTNSHAQGAVQ
jgi:hypothetical protein